MPARFIPRSQTVWRPRDKAPMTWPTYEVLSADIETVTVREVGNLLNVETRKWERGQFLELFEPVKHHGPTVTRDIRTRYEKMLDEDLC
jgi:hypothetical protein